jgi:S-adenosylmethionine-diacylglycerol 3-amino-3-carboxypropyl transferase
MLERGLTTAETTAKRRMGRAVRRSRTLSRDGMLEVLFTWAFRNLVYSQIWEDPDVDMAALAITPDCHVVTIASGGCNVLSYLVADPRAITAVDLNVAHIALNRLKVAAAQHLPTWASFYRFFGKADDTANIDAYWRHLAEKLDDDTRAYWEGRGLFGLGRRRISMFAQNIYRHGLLGRFIGLGHAVARAYGVDPGHILSAHSIEEQRSIYQSTLAPLFDKRLVRWAVESQLSLFGLGIPPAQYAALASAGDSMAAVLRSRVEKLTCDFSIDDNYFAWQAFGRSYGGGDAGPLPPYLSRVNYDCVRSRADRVTVVNRSFTEHLQCCDHGSVDRFVLLDAQDWMVDQQLNELWREITRTARPGARVIFRTAAEASLLPGRLDEEILQRWHYEADTSRALTARDRSAIYGGFHLYVSKD